MLFRPQGMYPARQAGPGDLLAAGESIATLALDSNQTLTAAMIAAGIISRSGMSAGRTDTTDTADNVLNALCGNDVDRNALAPGNTFRFEYRQSVAFATTWAHGRGWIAGTGGLDVAASTIKTFMVEILNATRETSQTCSTTGANAIITLLTPIAMGLVTPGMLVSGTGITAGSRVIGVTIGDTVNRINTDKIVAITIDQNTASAQAGTALTFSPVLRINGLGGKTVA